MLYKSSYYPLPHKHTPIPLPPPRYFLEPLLVHNVWEKFRLSIQLASWGVNAGVLLGGLLLTRLLVGVLAVCTEPAERDYLSMFNRELPRQKRFVMFMVMLLNSDILNDQAEAVAEAATAAGAAVGEYSYGYYYDSYYQYAALLGPASSYLYYYQCAGGGHEWEEGLTGGGGVLLDGSSGSGGVDGGGDISTGDSSDSTAAVLSSYGRLWFPLIMTVGYFISITSQLFRLVLRFYKQIRMRCGEMILSDASAAHLKAD
jgi:hypothetical protein